MKPCPHCGKELPQEMQFCPYCMEKLITETVIGDTPVRRRRRWWLWLVVLLLLLVLVLVCVLWLWRPWQPPPAKKEAAASVGAPTTTAAATSAAPTATKTTSPHQTASDPTTTTSTATQITPSTTHTTSSGGTSTTSRVTSVATSTTTRGSSSAGITASTGVADPCGAGHDWQSVTKTVQVDEVGHYETNMVEKRVTLFRCAICYEEYGELTDYYAHFDAEHGGDSLQAIFRDRYETVTEYREIEEKTWVVDTPAYDKTITVGRRCRVCGKTEIDQEKE